MEKDNKEDEKKSTKKKNGVEDDEKTVKNQVELNPTLSEAPLTLTQRRRRAFAMKKAAPRIKMGRKRAARKMANREKLHKRSLRKARELIRSKVAGKKGADYKNLSYGEKMSIDKQVEKRKSAIKRIAKRMLPKVTQAERERLKRATGSKKVNEGITCPDMEKSNKFHRLYGDDKRLRYDKRLKMNRHEAEPFDMSEFEDMYDQIVNEQFDETHMILESMPDRKDLENLRLQFERAAATRSDLMFDDKMRFRFLGRYMKPDRTGIDMVRKEMDAGDTEWREELAMLVLKTLGLEKAQAIGFNYNKSSPKVKEILGEEKNSCDNITNADIKELEKFADRLLGKFGIDIGFTTHFKDRMVDPRNNPCISVDDLRYFFRKVSEHKGKRIRKSKENEVVLKDIQQDLNLPVVIDIDRKGDLDVTLKTVMRKKKFQTPDPIIKY